MPWKPETTATSRRANPRGDPGAVDLGDAGGAVRAVGGDRDLPALPGAGVKPIVLEGDGEEPRGHLLAGGDDGVVFASIVEGGGLAGTRRRARWSCPPSRTRRQRHRSRPSTSRLTCRATLRMRSTSATEVPPNFMTRRGMDGGRAGGAASQGETAGIHDGEAVACQQTSQFPTQTPAAGLRGGR